MIDVSKNIIDWMKRESGIKRDATLLVLRELKTKQKDVQGDITDDIQYRFLKKMKSDRQKSFDIYSENNRMDLAEKEKNEILAIDCLINDLEKDMPKQMSPDEIQEILDNIKKDNGKIEMKTVMTYFKNINVDKSIVAKLAKEMI